MHPPWGAATRPALGHPHEVMVPSLATPFSGTRVRPAPVSATAPAPGLPATGDRGGPLETVVAVLEGVLPGAIQGQAHVLPVLELQGVEAVLLGRSWDGTLPVEPNMPGSSPQLLAAGGPDLRPR